MGEFVHARKLGSLINHRITGHLVFVLVSAEWVMCSLIDNSASCKICAVIHVFVLKT
jgi:hypothetical protein